MIKVHIILPVSSSSFLEKIKADYTSESLGAETTFTIAGEGAPRSVVTPEAAKQAEAPVVRTAIAAREAGADVVVVACFSDPGVAAAQNAVDIPVVGEGRTSIAAAGALFERFSILSASSTTLAAKAHMVAEQGLASRLRGVVPIDIPPLEMSCDRAGDVAALVAAETRAGSQAVVLACTGFEIGFVRRLKQELPGDVADRVVLVDPADTAGRVAVALAASKRNAAA